VTVAVQERAASHHIARRRVRRRPSADSVIVRPSKLGVIVVRCNEHPRLDLRARTCDAANDLADQREAAAHTSLITTVEGQAR